MDGGPNCEGDNAVQYVICVSLIFGHRDCDNRLRTVLPYHTSDINNATYKQRNVGKYKYIFQKSLSYIHKLENKNKTNIFSRVYFKMLTATFQGCI
jgi:hypothetical protein